MRKVVHGLKPALMMLMVQIAFASVNVLYKLAINNGMSVRVLTAYRLIFAAATTILLPLIFERKNRPKLTWRVVFMSFFCGLFGGSLFQNLYFESLALISATFASAVYNLIPAVTFILAVSFGFERLNIQTAAGKAKVVGTITGIGGAICFCFALWLIIQAKMSKEYQGHYSSTALMSLMGAIQATVFALCVEKDWSQWRLGWSIRLLTSAYSGIVASGIMVIVIAWCVGMRGPLYASVFNPLMLVLVAIAGSLMLDENLYLGSVVGAVLIMVGLYMVLWGKSKEMKKVTHLKITSEIDQIVVIVTPTIVDPENINRGNNNHTNSKSNINIVGKDHEHDNDSSKCEHEGQHNENNGKQELVSILQVKS
ncbi:hypothetical protein P8452_15214 [Trifolium repens]|nr:hypothetical protein P8452_15214 [Trifolium repens]